MRNGPRVLSAGRLFTQMRSPALSNSASFGRRQQVSFTRGGRQAPPSRIKNASRSSGSASIDCSVMFAESPATMYLQAL